MTAPHDGWAEAVDRLAALPPRRRREMLDRLLRHGAELGIAPLTHQQEAMWFLGRLRPDDLSYLSAGAYELRGPLEVDLLVESLRAVADRHDALRSVVFAIDGRPLSATLARGSVRPRVTDLAAAVGEATAEGAGPDHRLAAYVDAEIARPFLPDRDPLFRSTLVAVGPEHHVLLLVAHHLVADGRSMDVLFHDLAEVYRAGRAGRRPDLPPLPIGYADYARWQRAALTGPRLQAHVEHWRSRLAGTAAESGLPADRTGHGDHRRAGRRDVLVPARLRDRLGDVGRAEGATPHLTLLAGLAVLLSRYARREDVLLGVPTANRSHPQTEGLVGLFVNVVPFPVRLTAGLTGRELLHQVRDTAVGAYAHEEMPFGLLVEHLRPARQSHGDPLVHVLLDVGHAAGAGLRLDGVDVTMLRPHREGTPADLAISIGPGEGGLTGTVSYDRDLFDPGTVDRLIARWLLVLDQLAGHPDAPVDTLLLTTPSERAQLLAWGRG